ncbi:protein kinase, partial [Frankia sp. CIT1]|uniref:protein kinase domain-containing protein n=1 Tax=Frankia sp. CIT1 TaxID=2880974 RepID=UPI001EF41067
MFAGYRIEGIRGSGSFGAVYVALEAQVGGHRRIALKVIDPAVGVDGVVGRERFLREARALGAGHHPHIVPVYNAGEQDGLLYLAMPLMPGDLDEEIQRRGMFPPAVAGRVASQVAEALNA